jgi:tetratricopeptide (TPR) repeat protein
MLSKPIWRLAALASLLVAGSPHARSDTPAPSETLVRQGRELMKQGRIVAAKEQFEAAFRSSGDAEALFLAAECWEKLGNDDEARTLYRKYLQHPLAVKAFEANARIQAIEERANGETDRGPKKPPRYVLVPVANDHGACARRCTGVEVCPRPARRGSFAMDVDQCRHNQFSCLQGCAGATVWAGACPKISPQQQLHCFQDKRSAMDSGWLVPAHF